MVVGLGIDVASIARIERALERFGERFVLRVLTEEEASELSRSSSERVSSLAGRFAAKEALAKALGGPKDVSFRDVQIRRGVRGAPLLTLFGPARACAERLGVRRQHLSITHDAGVAVAVVILEGDAA